MLRGLRLKAVYQSDEDDLLKDFYIPALRVGRRYDRAVGFFSGAMLSFAAQGLSAFVENEGRMRLVVGGELDEEDALAIERGYDLRVVEEKVGRSMVKAIDAIDDDLFQSRLELLSWLVASGRLDVKVALKRRGMFHSKIGIIEDAAGDAVVFQGSANETAYALLPDFNFESLDVFPTWRKEFADHFKAHLGTFDRLWSNAARGTLVVDFPAAARERLVKVARKARVPRPEIEAALWEAALRRHAPERPDGMAPSLPTVLSGQPFEVKEHQKAALQAWKAAGGQGILALATGSGKTVTAIYGAVVLQRQAGRLCLVVAVPYQNLADQWVDTLRLFNVGAFACYGGAEAWRGPVEEAVHLFNGGAWPFLCLVVVNKTLCGDAFRSVLARLPGDKVLWVGDECHHHGGPGFPGALPGHVNLRLGLSATPEHYLDGAANARLADYYGRVVSTFGLDRALKENVLTPYRYEVHLVDLTPEEADAYAELSARIARLVPGGGAPGEGGDPRLDRLLHERARLLGGAANKLPLLDRLLATAEPSPHVLFYCSDATLPGEDGPQRQVEAVSTLLHRRGWRNSRFTAREGRRERRAILDGFRLGDIDALVAIRCLDEGIDVPACQRAYVLASSRNPRQFVQRRGRILRRSPGKSMAHVVDFVVRVPEGVAASSSTERGLLAGELRRVAEFARLALNPGETVEALAPLLERYDLAHHLV